MHRHLEKRVINTHHGANLLKHLQYGHPDQFNIVTEINKSKAVQNKQSNDTYERVLLECTNLVAIHGRPFTLMDDTAFQNLLSLIPNKTNGINSSKIRNNVETMATKLRDEIRKKLEKRTLCLKADIASVGTRFFLGVNCQYLENGHIVLKTLAVTEIFQRHTSEHLKDLLIFILQRYRIDIKQIYCITTDNGANMIKMTKLVNEAQQPQAGPSSSQSANNIDSDSDSDSDSHQDTGTEAFTSRILEMQFPTDSIPTEHQNEIGVVRCAAHTLQLAMQDASNDLGTRALLSECREVVRRLRTPQFVRILKEHNKPIPKLDCTTRWHSTVDMVESLLGLKEICLSNERLQLSSTSWVFLEDFLRSMAPGKILTKKLQEEQLTVGNFYLEWMMCQYKLQKIGTELANNLLHKMKEREITLFETDTFINGIFLDPRVNSTLTPEKLSRAKDNLIKLFFSHNTIENVHSVDYNLTESSHNQNATQEARTDMEEFLNSCYINRQNDLSILLVRNDPHGEIRNTLEQAFNLFLDEPLIKSTDDVLAYWEKSKFKFPLLYKLSTIVLAAPMTQVNMCSWWILLTVLAANLVHCNENEVKDPTPVIYEPSWVYKCIPNVGCQRSNHPKPELVNVSSVYYQSLDLCRTVCGRFGGIWPKPLSAGLSTQTVQMHPTYLRYDLSDVPAGARETIAQMTKVTSANIMAECGGNVTEVVDTPVVVYLVVASDNLDLTWDTDEKYDLDVQTKNQKVSVTITAGTIYGARHALETFSQLITSDKPDFLHQDRCGLRIIAGARIKDYPAYKHRGLVLDTSRHFIPMKDIKRTIDAMAASKLNVFHWHVTDSHSFPLESTRVPQFTRYGAYSASEIYSAEETRELIKYAQLRGVRVVIEIDSPAHAGNGWQWGEDYGFGELAVCVNSEPWRGLCIQPPCGQLNPANPTMYKVLRNLYKDLAEVLPKPALFHMGGDEIVFQCWNSSQQIRSYMDENNMNRSADGFLKLWSEFHAKILQIWDEELKAAGTEQQQPVVLWSSQLTKSGIIQKMLNKDRYVIEVWEPLDNPLLIELLRLGYKTISVPKDIWYLDHGFWGVTKFSNWRRMYSYLLPKHANMLGGEVAMWSEYVDKEVLDTRIWPRAAAVAERLWADPMSTASAAEPRLQRFRSRLIARGLQPDAMSPAWCEQHDGRCL